MALAGHATDTAGAKAVELYTYARSVAAHRVRIALNYKLITYTSRYVDVTGEDLQDYRFRRLNPQGLAPVLVDDGHVISQSMAILEYLEERVPVRPLLPPDPWGRARVRSLAQLFVADVQPLHNRRVLRFLRDRVGVDDGKLDRWFKHWVMQGLEAAEYLLSGPETGSYCHGEQPTLADACLVPEVHRALARGYDLSAFPRVRSVYHTCTTLAAFQAAAPETQADVDGWPERSPSR